MDFNYSEEQEAVRQLAAQIFGERSTHDRLKQVEAEAGDDGPDRPRPLSGTGQRGAARHPPGRGRSAAPVSTSWPPAWSSRRPAAPPPTCRSSRRWSTARCRSHRFGTDAQRKALATGRGRRRDHPDRGDGRAGRRGHRARWYRADHECDAARGRVVGPLGHQGLCPGRAGGRRDPGAGHVPRGGRCGQRRRRVHRRTPTAPGLTKTRQSTTTGRPEAIVELDGVVVGGRPAPR